MLSMTFFRQTKADVLRHLRILRKIALRGCSVGFATVSGVLSTKPALLKYASRSLRFDIITTKSFQVEPNMGNREPVVCQPEPLCFGNSVGLRNPGIKVAEQGLKKFFDSNKTFSVLNVSLSASSPEDFIYLIKRVKRFTRMVELNFSCPHASAGFGSSIGGDIEIATEYVRKIVAAKIKNAPLIFIKLTPNVENIGEIARSVVEAGADGIVAINTVGPDLYIEEHSKSPILQNKIGGRGGKSGKWIFEKAISCVKEIREAIGEDVPIIGMGGVSSGEDVAKMIWAGANVVGIGSALGTVRQEDWGSYILTLRQDACRILAGKASCEADKYIIKQKRMEYVPHKITRIDYESENVMIMQLEGKMPFQAGEFVFLWLPLVGEKPFSLALDSPITFIIKRRGQFTSELFKKKVGDVVYIRGLYGAPAVLPKSKKAVLVAGGTGIALLPSLAKKLKENGTKLKMYVGYSENKIYSSSVSNKSKESPDGENIIEATLKKYGELNIFYDDGVVGRVLDVLEKTFALPLGEDVAVYTIGPEPFMMRAISVFSSQRIPKDRIFLSLEKQTMCGVGLCGECSCGNKLTCQSGTFLSLKELRELEEYENLHFEEDVIDFS